MKSEKFQVGDKVSFKHWNDPKPHLIGLITRINHNQGSVSVAINGVFLGISEFHMGISDIRKLTKLEKVLY